jgi:hypothetical protein
MKGINRKAIGKRTNKDNGPWTKIRFLGLTIYL